MEVYEEGCFKKGLFSAVPYKHYKMNWVWNVEVIKKLPDEEYDRRSIRVIARTAIEASNEAFIRYSKVVEMEYLIKEEKKRILEEEREAKQLELERLKKENKAKKASS